MTDVMMPPRRLISLSAAERAAIAAAVQSGTSEGLAWQEKLRRFASLSGRNLKNVARDRFGHEANLHLVWIRELLLDSCDLKTTHRLVDHALLNAALYCRDALPAEVTDRAAAFLEDLYNVLINTAARPLDPAAIGAEFFGDLSHWKAEAEKASGIVIIAPSPFSLAALCVYRLLQNAGIPIAALVLRRFTLARFHQEWRRDGVRLLSKIWRKLVLRADENPDVTAVSLKTLLNDLAPDAVDVRVLARTDGVPVIEVSDLEMAAAAIADYDPQIAIFTGGGLIREPLIGAFRHGIVNVHMGSLPMHKGMDVVQAPILEGHFEDIALTAHLIAPGLDEGPVLERVTIGSDCYGTLGALRNEISALMPLLGVDAALGCLSGRLSPMRQPEAGRQYFFLHRDLEKVLNKVIATRHRSTARTPVQNIVDRAIGSGLIR